MGCFLACFGYSKNRKRRAKTVLEGGQRFASYEPLEAAQSPISCSNSDNRGKDKKRSSLKPRKKVRFNLNVESYEPIPNDTYLESEGEENAKQSPWVSEESDSTASGMGSYPSNYRYKNCLDSYEDDEDGMLSAESDLEEDYYDDDFDGKDENEDGDENYHHPETQRLKAADPIENAGDRSQCVRSVLNPVENLSQWKAIKAKPALQLKNQRKENVALEQEPLSFSSRPCNLSGRITQCKPKMQEIPVDLSLSNWLPSSKKTISATQDCSIDVR